VAYEFTENDHEFEPQTSSARRGGPPRKLTAVDVLDPPFPPKKPPGPIPATPSSLLFRIFAGLLLAGLASAILFLLFAKR
jgi:hypothetical protein